MRTDKMVVTRSQSGEPEPKRFGPPASPATEEEAGSSSAGPKQIEHSTDASSGPTEMTGTDTAKRTPSSQKTLRPEDTKSRRSTSSRKKLLAELEAKERLARAKVQQAQAEMELVQLRMQAEVDSSDVEEEDEDLASVRIGAWLSQPAAPLLKGEAPPPLPDASGGRPPMEPTRVNECAAGKETVGQSVVRGNSDRSAHDLKSTVIDVGTLAAALSQAARSNREPPKYMQQLPLFNGDSGEWLSFKAAYSDSCKCFTSVENVARLRKCLRGTAKEAAGCLLLSQPDPLVIMEALERRFGRPESLILTELGRIKMLSKVNDNPRDLCIFAGRIANTVGTIEALKRVYYLHNPELVRIILDKLTPILRNKWYDYAALRKGEDIPEIKRLSSFLNEEADKCGAYALPEHISEDVNTGARNRKKVERTFNVDRSASSSDNCFMCKRDHKLTECTQFLELDVNARWELAKKHGICFRCLRSKHRRFMCRAPPCGFKGCTVRHHKLLHYERNSENRSQETTTATTVPTAPEIVTSATERANASAGFERRSYLKVIPVTLSGPYTTVDTYALLDDGSTVTLLDSSVADILGVDGPVKGMWIQGVGTETKHEKSRVVNLTVKGKYSNKKHLLENVRTVDRLSISAQSIDSKELNSYNHLNGLIEELTYERARPMLLIGQDNWHLLISKNIRSGKRNQPVASYTELGWVLHGCQSSSSKAVAFCGNINLKEEPIDELVKNFFKLESLGIEPRKPINDPEQRALTLLDKKSRRLTDGRFETGLLWKEDNVDMPNNRADAERRLYSLERRLDRDQDLKCKYAQQMNNLFESGYAEKADKDGVPGKTWYLPHFPVINPAKAHKPPRLVHDAAARAAGVSLNDLLLSGPDLLQSLPGVLMRFRQERIAVSADIKEMFRQIRIREEDRDALRFLWRDERREGPPSEYRMTTVLFGTTSSPCTALYIKNKNAEEYADKYPEAAVAIKRNHYMDDYLHSFATVEEATIISSQVNFIHKQAGFQLCGWTSNNRNALEIEAAPPDLFRKIGGSDSDKALGLRWNVQTDCFEFKINGNKTPQVLLECIRPPTKREALSIIMAIFDPLGFISPITTPAKRILQDTWKYKTEWDKPLPEELQVRWVAWMEVLRNIGSVQVPRCYDYELAGTRQLHVFVDASEEAYAAAVYWRIQRPNGTVHTALVAAKSRVAPLKPVSIPRLELQAALLGARLASTVAREHDFAIESNTYWSDSRTALAWIRAEPRTFKTFVAHRIAEIEDLTKKNEWRWLPSHLNVADDATRATPREFNACHRWFRGPDFLSKEESEWPQETKAIAIEDTGEERTRCNVATLENEGHAHLPDVNRFSNWNKLIRSTARVLQFLDKCRPDKEQVEYKRTRKNKEKDPTWSKIKLKPSAIKSKPIASNNNYVHLPASYIIKAEMLWVKAAQKDSFGKEIDALVKGKAPPSENRLYTLSVYLDNVGILRLRSRITAAQDLDSCLSPPVLDGSHKYMQLYIQNVHKKLHHSGLETIVNEIRQSLWLVKLRSSIKNVLKNCPKCKINKAKPAAPSTGDLPHARLAHHARPFTFTGLDYFGPMSVTVGRHKEKRYGALFTCMTSRAIHIELVYSLSADSAIAALRRFICRRGYPKEIWSDNATCFKAADRELGESAIDALKFESTAKSIKWKFIPPASPFMGGAWERMVGLVKKALYSTLIEQAPSDETLQTLMVEVENTVNSRPLTHVALTPDDHDAITPNHILLGPGCHVPPPGCFTPKDVSARQQWRRAQALADIFWQRWVREYLPLLQNRREPYGSGVAPKVGDVVLVSDPDLPRNTWPRGRIVKVYPGQDGEVRVVDLATKGGIMKRPTKRIVVLP